MRAHSEGIAKRIAGIFGRVNGWSIAESKVVDKKDWKM